MFMNMSTVHIFNMGTIQLGLNFLWVSSFIYYIRLDNFRGEIGDA